MFPDAVTLIAAMKFLFTVSIFRALGELVATVAIPDANVALNVITVLLLVVFGPRYIRHSQLRAQAEEIKGAYEAKEILCDSLTEQLAGAQNRANEEQTKVASHMQEISMWKARYEEQSRYTAGPAMQEILEVIKQDHHFKREMTAMNAAIVEILKRQGGNIEDLLAVNEERKRNDSTTP